MADRSDIIIIGAGLMGLCTADAAAARGASVTIIDARPGPCEGTSFSNSGMIHPSQAQSWVPGQSASNDLDAARVTVALAERSKTILLEQSERFGLPTRPAGCLQLHSDMDITRAAQTAYDAIGVRSDIVIDPIDSFGLPASFFPNDTSGDAHAFGQALAADLERRGVQFIYGSRDLDFRQIDEGFTLRVSGQVLTTTHLVLAAATHTVDLLARLQIRMQLNPVAGAAADFALPGERDDFPSCPVMDAQSRSALTVFEDRVRISGGWGLEHPEALLERWRDIAPALMLRLGQPFRIWTGIRPVSPVGRPYISGTSIPNLWVNTGHGHMGWTLCSGSGELLAEMILEGREDRRFSFSG